MKKTILILSCMIAFLILSACKNVNDDIDNTSNTPTNPISQASTPAGSADQITPADQDDILTAPIPTEVSSDTNEYDVIRDGYNEGTNIAVSYPQIKGLEDAIRQDKINELLKQAAMSYLDDASGLVNLDISYEIEWKGNNLLSVQYYGWEEYSDAPHPYNLFFITNINMNTGNKLKLQDMFQVDQNMIDSIIKNGKYAGPLSPDDPNLMDEVRVNTNNSLTTSGLPDMTFYFTRDSFGISIDINHVYGDYAMIETKYSDLKSCIASGNEVWKDFEENIDNDTDDLADSDQIELSYEMTLSDIYEFTEIESQSFPVTLEGWGPVRFVSGKDYQGKLLFFLTDEKDNILYRFPDYYDSYRKNQTVSGVAFKDVNKDGLKDILIIAACDSKATSCDIYFQTEYSFVQYPDLYHDLNQSAAAYDTLAKVMDYMNQTGNAIVAEFTKDTQWKQAYIDYIQSSLNTDAWDGYELIHLNDDDIPELVAIGYCEAQGNLVCNYDNGIVNTTQLSRLGFYYIDGENLLCNSEGLMDNYYDIVYSLKGGKLTQIAAGYWGELDGTGHHFDDDGNLIYQYSWDGTTVTEAEYNQKLNSIFDMSKATDGYTNQAYSTDEIINMIKGY